jgi:hypothetical protein
MTPTFTNILIIVLISICIILLGIQIYVFYRIRKSLSLITQFFRFVNRIIKDMEKIQSNAVHSIQESQQTIQSLNKGSVKSNQKKICQSCKNRVSFLRFDENMMEFSYQCRKSKKTIVLSDSCQYYEMDLESTKPGAH